MNTEATTKNEIKVVGTFLEYMKDFTHGNTTYKVFKLSVKRKSGVADILNCYVYEGYMNDIDIHHKICIKGALRQKTNSGHFIYYVQAHSITNVDDSTEDYNTVQLLGNVVTMPNFKVSMRGRRICEFLISVPQPKVMNNNTGTATQFSDRIPIISWDDNAEAMASTLYKGQLIMLTGRLQSRVYVKDGVERMIHEVSVSSYNYDK